MAAKVIALVTQFGGPTSHTAIIARQLGIPCIVAVSNLERVSDGTPIVVDGTTGTIRWGVPELEAQKLVLEETARRAEIAAWKGPAHLASGQSVQLLANVPYAAPRCDDQARETSGFGTGLSHGGRRQNATARGHSRHTRPAGVR